MNLIDIVILEQAGLTKQIQQGFNGHKKDEYCDQRATGASTRIWSTGNLRYRSAGPVRKRYDTVGHIGS